MPTSCEMQGLLLRKNTSLKGTSFKCTALSGWRDRISPAAPRVMRIWAD
jgi:hypothetical protein